MAGKRTPVEALELKRNGYAQVRVLLVLALVILIAIAVMLGTAHGAGSPHGNYLEDTDVCAMCHRSHTGTLGGLLYPVTTFEAELCYICHGPERAGSIYDVKTAFDTPSTYPYTHPVKDDFNGASSIRQYEETGPHVEFSPLSSDPGLPNTGWVDYGPNPGYSGDYIKLTSMLNGTATFTVPGPYFGILAWKHASGGTAEVWIDGSYDATISFQSATEQYQQPVYTKSNLGPGDHTIVVYSKGWTNVDAYQISVTGIDCHDCHDPHQPGPTLAGGVEASDPNPANPFRYEETDPSISYTRTWSEEDNVNHSGGSAKKTTEWGADADFTFTGTSVTIISRQAPGAGYIGVWLDGQWQGYVSLDGASQYQVPVFSITDLRYDNHTLKMRNYYVSPGKNTIWIDALDVSPPLIAYTPVNPAAEVYQLCFKCHSGYADPMAGSNDKAREFSTGNPSYHPVKAIGANQGIRTDAFVGPWNDQSTLPKCDCHIRFPTQPLVQPAWAVHGLENPSILVGGYENMSATDPNLVCFDCHTYYTYTYAHLSQYSGYRDSRFGAGGISPWSPDSHGYHVGGRGYHCQDCHQVHGSTKNRFLLRDDIWHWRTATGGACSGGPWSGQMVPGCHAHPADSFWYSVRYP